MTPKEKEVRLTPACLRAIGAGRKSQMRTVVKLDRGEAPAGTSCPLGAPGDLMRADDEFLLRITAVRMQLLQDISDPDLVREGGMWRETAPSGTTESDREGFARWWDEVHAGSEAKWIENPWVWVVEFERR